MCSLGVWELFPQDGRGYGLIAVVRHGVNEYHYWRLTSYSLTAIFVGVGRLQLLMRISLRTALPVTKVESYVTPLRRVFGELELLRTCGVGENLSHDQREIKSIVSGQSDGFGSDIERDVERLAGISCS